jgi:hypothetical protein
MSFKLFYPSIRLSSSQFLNTPSRRFFHPSTANMGVKCYFDLTWSGPAVEIDETGKVTSTGKDAVGKSTGTFSSSMRAPLCAPPLCSFAH